MEKQTIIAPLSYIFNEIVTMLRRFVVEFERDFTHIGVHTDNHFPTLPVNIHTKACNTA